MGPPMFACSPGVLIQSIAFRRMPAASVFLCLFAFLVDSLSLRPKENLNLFTCILHVHIACLHCAPFIVHVTSIFSCPPQELPCLESEPLLHTLVLAHMIHGPCGDYNPHSPCMKDGRCTKNYPKPFNESTFISDKGFAVYGQRKASPTGKIKDFIVNSSWVVPYNIDLLLQFKAYTNVEICNYGRMIKYLFKYVHKGPDRATALMKKKSKHIDEIKRYLDTRYISASEAAWRLFEFKLHKRYPSTERLQFHLPNQQMVYFRDDGSIEDVIDLERNKKTMFTEWFSTNRRYLSAKKLMYIDFPRSFVWNKQLLEWMPRKQATCICCLLFAQPASGERYYLRTLLGSIRRPTSFDDLRTVNGILHPDYKSTCGSLGLLESDNEFDSTLHEAAL